MDDPDTWQPHALEQLSQHFAAETDAKAFVVTGSLATADIEPDFWSDIDAKIVLVDQTIERYSTSLAWLQPFGQLIGVEQHVGSSSKTVRVCMEGFKRFDLVFIPESALHSLTAEDEPLFRQPCAILWSRLPGFEKYIAPSPASIIYEAITEATIADMADRFWFKAAVAITKVMRNDLLIGLHLALDLARDCLVLQMLRRDQALRTTIHRTGGWGNVWAEQFSWDCPECSEIKILDLVARSCISFDELASTLSPGYKKRWPLLSPAIARAKNVLGKTWT